MSLQITSRGHGPDLALVHGWGLGADVWNSVAEALAAHCHVHLVSLPGYDNSTNDGLDFADTAAALVDVLPRGTTLCGWSLGGMLAMDATARHPDHFARLALVGSSPSFVQRDHWPQAQPPALLDTFRQAIADDARGTLSRFVMLFNQGDAKARAATRALTPLLAESLPATTTLLRGLDWLSGVDLRQRIAGLTLPTLLLHGDRDPLMPIAAAEALVRDMTAARLQRFAGCAHAPFVSAPEDFAAALNRFCHEPA